MKIIETGIEGLFVIEPKVFSDARGHFFESYNKEKFFALGIRYEFVQDNQSLSNAGVVRGLHFQRPPHAQGKLVRVVKGAVLDVAVDIRKGSPTYGKFFAHELTEENFNLMWIPPGFAHGFKTLRDNTLFQYKCTDTYHPETEGAIRWNDPDIGIDWGIENPILSAKDQTAPFFKDFDSPFIYGENC
ncbi:dTDP-4-dehydrorhamnose 3,5-epimerase [Thermaurantimonas aggregans]|uniref:dTDP-4-dehydrorhamnose 3,5-epimerase n=1 Tax=Thermaurantimonas aggregans TaxID=2173829 RepID=UPI000F570A0B|nr:dTDP-4-dehydrorhamnose 3,5-epimerase [Thermaurantimonas aggregans]MCX8149071.1 dTDP-4-dehydrorhamnose 3,5-epimerase [Thermaurantimonas aggregans]